jgi:Protein of unknown function (DUF3822)
MKEVYHIKAETTADPAQSVLLIELGAGFVVFGKMSQAGLQLQEAGYYVAENEEEDLLKSLFVFYPELGERYHQVLLSYATPQSVLTPAHFYSYEKGEQLIKAIYGDAEPYTVINESLPDWQLCNVFGVPSGMHAFAVQQFINARYWHRYTLSIKNKPAGTDQLLVNFDAKSFTALVFKNNNLQLAQTFAYTTPEDVLYALLKTCTVFGLSQETTALVVSGLAEMQSALYRELHQYFKNTSLAVPGEQIRLDAAFADFPAHYFTSLYNLAACVS